METPVHDANILFDIASYIKYRVFVNAKYCIFYTKKYFGVQKMKCNASLGRTRLTGH